MPSLDTTISITDVPQVRAALERERLAARASLAALLLLTDPRASQQVAAARPRIRAGYLLVADEILDAYDVSPLPEAKPGQTPGLIYKVVPEDNDGEGFTTVSGHHGPPGFEAALHDAIVRAAAKGLANVVMFIGATRGMGGVITHAEMQAEPEVFARPLSDAATHAARLIEWVMITTRVTPADTDASVFVRTESEAKLAMRGVLNVAVAAGQIEDGNDRLFSGEAKRQFFQSLVDSEATRDAAHALEQLDALRNTAIPCARVRDELLAPARRFLGEIVRPPLPQSRGAR